MTDESAQDRALAAWRRAYQQTLAEGSEDCPDSERLSALLLAGEITAEEREALAEHVVGCIRCSQAYALLAELHEDARGQLSAEERRRIDPRAPAGAPSWRIAAAAAVLVLGIGVGYLAWRGWSPGRPGIVAERGAAEADLQVEPADGATLAVSPERLTWPSQEGAESYKVVLFDFESSQIWESPPVHETSVILPDAVRTRLERGRRHYWRVFGLVGVERRESPLYGFTLAP